MYADALIVGVSLYPAEIAQTDTTHTRTINCMKCMYMCMRERDVLAKIVKEYDVYQNVRKM